MSVEVVARGGLRRVTLPRRTSSPRRAVRMIGTGRATRSALPIRTRRRAGAYGTAAARTNGGRTRAHPDARGLRACPPGRGGCRRPHRQVQSGTGAGRPGPGGGALAQECGRGAWRRGGTPGKTRIITRRTTTHREWRIRTKTAGTRWLVTESPWIEAKPSLSLTGPGIGKGDESPWHIPRSIMPTTLRPPAGARPTEPVPAPPSGRAKRAMPGLRGAAG
jgi:hypothetical protein